jgi:very-short-patch-repair endonuclease
MPQVKQLRDIHRRLAAAAPVWANRMLDDPSAAGDPTRFPDAWRWRRLETWLDTIQRANDPSTLQRQLEQLAARRRRVTAELVSERAWRRLADCLGPVQRQALNSYMQAVKRFGKTGGKYAARWLREIREALNESKQSVPVWIMTTNRALSSFRPDATPAFDVLIIDEASQISLQALPLLSLARRAIIVGDDKQTSPDHVGLDRQAVFGLLDDHLSTISKYQTLFDPDNSLYDLAVQKFPEIITLTEHFRCLPPIIQFSNIHAYDGRIIPLRDQAPSVDWKPLSSIFVRDGYRVGDINEPEADAVVELLEMLHTNPRYEGMDFGVISLLGSSQSKRIWDKVLDRLGPDVLTDRRLRCGEPANFQGDERDVMILSTVVATDPNVPTARIGAMTGRAAERRINVAASRARNQMWVVHSVDPDRFPPGDLRGELIRHCQNPTQLSAAVGDLEAACDSDFERHVLRKIVARGYRRLTTQHRVGRFRIDIVVHGPNARLAVECDGDRWHGEEEWHRDRARQQVLERAGWTFERIRGSSFYRDPDRALEPLWRRLDELGIPLGEWVDEVPSATTSIPMAQPVRRRDGLGDNTSAATAPTPEVDGRQGLPLSSSQTRRSEVAEPPAAELPSIRALPVRATSDSTGERLPQHLSDGAPAHRPFLAPRSTPPPAPQRATTAQPGNGGAFGHARRASPAQPARRTGIAPYSSWQMRPLPSVYDYPRQRTISGLVEIVAAEGPILVWRAFQLYVKASGGERVGSAVREQLLRLVASAARSGRLAQIKDGVPRIEKTLYMPGTPPVILRQRGPRQLIEIPRSEIKALVEHLGLSGAPPATVKRAVLDVLELTRLTSRVDEYLDDCFSYQWYP